MVIVFDVFRYILVSTPSEKEVLNISVSIDNTSFQVTISLRTLQ